MSNELTTTQTGGAINLFAPVNDWEMNQRMATALCHSTLVPKEYQGKDKLANVLIAMEMAQRTNSSVLQVMQNLYIVHGRPSWSSQFIMAAINTCGRFEPLRFDVSGEGDEKQCIAWTKDKATGERLESPPITIRMAKEEGWYGKTGSKWKTMPDVMLRYRAASFFGRIYAPDVLMGMYSAEEMREMKDITPITEDNVIDHQDDIIASLNAEVAYDKETGEIFEASTVAGGDNTVAESDTIGELI